MEDIHIEYLLKMEKQGDIEGIRVFLHGMCRLKKMAPKQAKALYEHFVERRSWHRHALDVWNLLDQFRMLSIPYNNPVCIGKKFYKKDKRGVMEIQTLEQFLKTGGTLQGEGFRPDVARDFDDYGGAKQ